MLKVQQKDLWSVIGGRMGFVQFPGTETEPAKCGPVTAAQLEHLYKEYLASFDRAYIANVLDSRLKGQFPSNANQLSLMVSMADRPVHQLRSQGFSENMIQFMETHRAHLQRMRLERDGFHEAVKPNPGDANPQVQASGNMGIQNMNNGVRQPLYTQFVPQNGAGGPVMEGRQQLSQQHPPLHSGMMVNRPGREQAQAALAFISRTQRETMASSK